MRAAGVRAVVDASSLAVVGLAEVVTHVPRIYGEYRKLLNAARKERPNLAILTDSPDFHLRLARQLKRSGVPVLYLVAPQVWAWRKGRLRGMRRSIDRLLCIFPFEEEFFTKHGVPATHIGHPLSRLVRAELSRSEFLERHSISPDRPVVALLPGSRRGEARRHMPALYEAAERMARKRQLSFILALPGGGFAGGGSEELHHFRERISGSTIQVLEGQTWDVLAHASIALAASGTVTVEAALLGTPMVTFYKVSWLSWVLGRLLVDVPFYSMVNLIAGRAVVPELIQSEMTGARLASEGLKLLEDSAARELMRRELEVVARALAGPEHPIARAAGIVEEVLATQR